MESFCKGKPLSHTPSEKGMRVGMCRGLGRGGVGHVFVSTMGKGRNTIGKGVRIVTFETFRKTRPYTQLPLLRVVEQRQ